MGSSSSLRHAGSEGWDGIQLLPCGMWDPRDLMASEGSDGIQLLPCGMWDPRDLMGSSSFLAACGIRGMGWDPAPPLRHVYYFKLAPAGNR